MLFCVVLLLLLFAVCVLVLIEDTLTYSPTSGNSLSKTKRFDDRLSLERARHEQKKIWMRCFTVLHCLIRIMLLGFSLTVVVSDVCSPYAESDVQCGTDIRCPTVGQPFSFLG